MIMQIKIYHSKESCFVRIMERKMESVSLHFNFYDCCSNYGDFNLEKATTLVLSRQL